MLKTCVLNLINAAYYALLVLVCYQLGSFFFISIISFTIFLLVQSCANILNKPIQILNEIYNDTVMHAFPTDVNKVQSLLCTHVIPPILRELQKHVNDDISSLIVEFVGTHLTPFKMPKTFKIQYRFNHYSLQLLTPTSVHSKTTKLHKKKNQCSLKKRCKLLSFLMFHTNLLCIDMLCIDSSRPGCCLLFDEQFIYYLYTITQGMRRI